MCDEDAVERLMTLNFAGYVDEVGEALSFKARNADPRIRPFYSRILYTWYVARSDYRNGQLVCSSPFQALLITRDGRLTLSRTHDVPTGTEACNPNR